MLANLAAALFTHKSIKTTETRAKRLRPVAERLVTFAKRGDLASRRRVLGLISNKGVVHELFTDIAQAVENRDGGYTRITKIGNRKGDNAPMAVIELVEALTVAQQAVGEAERARGTRFAPRKGAASAAGEVTADAVETAEAETAEAEDTTAEDTTAEDTTAEDSPEEIVDDVFLPDGERQDDGDVTPEPERENAAVVDSDNVSPEVAAAAAAEVEAAELGDAATAGVDSPGGESAPDPK